ncbi:MAG TPA: hypothetical protein VFJ82_15680 [Longimicrobium sp.]|nr:hypothetical protein [Longimicrobium sp.]
MSNLTFDEKLIRQHTPEPLEGHTVVVLERVGEAGEKFHSVLEPGGDPLRPGILAMMLGRPNVYFAFAVDASRERGLEFDERVHMAERAHELQLHFTVLYRVADPKLLVAAREQDPLERVRKRVAEVITEEIAELPWTEVWHSFRPASERVVASTLVGLKSFARDYGIAINSLKLKAGFDQGVAYTDREIHAARERGRSTDEHGTMAHAARGRLDDIILDRYADFLRGAHDVDDLRYVYRSLSGEPASAGVGAPGATGDPLPGVLNDLITLTQSFDTEIQRRQVQAALLHLVAAVVAEDTPQVTPEQAGYARRAQTALAAATHLPPDHLERLRELAEPGMLRSWPAGGLVGGAVAPATVKVAGGDHEATQTASSHEDSGEAKYRVWYATNRKPRTGGRMPGYGGQVDASLHTGYCDVHIPATHRTGELGSGVIRRIVTGVDDRLKLMNVVPLGTDEF